MDGGVLKGRFNYLFYHEDNKMATVAEMDSLD